MKEFYNLKISWLNGVVTMATEVTSYPTQEMAQAVEAKVLEQTKDIDNGFTIMTCVEKGVMYESLDEVQIMKNFENREDLIKSIEKKILELTSDFANYFYLVNEAANGKGSEEDLIEEKDRLFSEMEARSLDYECAKFDTFKTVEETMEDLFFEDYE